MKPFFDDKEIPIFFASNNDFVPVFSVCLASLAENASPDFNYDIVLLNTDISEENKKKLSETIKTKNNISLRFYNVADTVAGFSLKANAHISVETYFRFIIQEIMPDIKKALYLDCDLVVLRDVAELYRTDVNGFVLAAAKDPEFIGQASGAKKKTVDYIRNSFPIKNAEGYFQAGVILFNLEELRRIHTVGEWLNLASVPYMYNDQDVLNLCCEGKVLYLDMFWNVLHDCDRSRIKYIISKAPEYIQDEYFKARENPYIIHYAGHKKPWNDAAEDFAEVFWQFAEKSPYYGELRDNLNKKEKEARRFSNRLKRGCKKIVDCFFPPESAGREFIKVIFGYKN